MDALLALRRGDDSYEADVGALLIAEALMILRKRGGL